MTEAIPKPKTLQEALVIALADMPNPVKNSDNPAFKRDGKPMRYADLEATLDACKPVLSALGLAVMQMPVSDERGLGVHTVIIGYGKTLDCGSFTLPLEAQTPQKGAGAVTYARRYALTALFGLAQEDDDANAASAPKPAASAPAAGKTYGAGNAGGADEKLLKRIYAKRKGLGYSDAAWNAKLQALYGVTSDKDLAADQADDLLKKLVAAEKAAEKKQEAGEDDTPTGEPEGDMWSGDEAKSEADKLGGVDDGCPF
jgi:hypothetical protein